MEQVREATVRILDLLNATELVVYQNNTTNYGSSYFPGGGSAAAGGGAGRGGPRSYGEWRVETGWLSRCVWVGVGVLECIGHSSRALMAAVVFADSLFDPCRTKFSILTSSHVSLAFT